MGDAFFWEASPKKSHSNSCYQKTIPIPISTRRATTTTKAEIIKPWSMGLGPAFFSLPKDVLHPMAAKAQTIKNLLRLLVWVTSSAGIENRLATPDIAKNPRINHGKILQK